MVNSLGSFSYFLSIYTRAFHGHSIAIHLHSRNPVLSENALDGILKAVPTDFGCIVPKCLAFMKIVF